jgi:hypothetical protein
VELASLRRARHRDHREYHSHEATGGSSRPALLTWPKSAHPVWARFRADRDPPEQRADNPYRRQVVRMAYRRRIHRRAP